MFRCLTVYNISFSVFLTIYYVVLNMFSCSYLCVYTLKPLCTISLCFWVNTNYNEYTLYLKAEPRESIFACTMILLSKI